MSYTLCPFHLQACYIGDMPANGRAYGHLLAVGTYLVPLSLSFYLFLFTNTLAFIGGKKKQNKGIRKSKLKKRGGEQAPNQQEKVKLTITKKLRN